MSSNAEPKKRKILQVESLSKHFKVGPNVVKAVQNISFDVAAGEVVLIMGPSGSGKTTLLMMIGALLTPTEGNISLEEEDITRMSKREKTRMRALKIGFIFQSFNLLNSLSTMENVSIILQLIGRNKKQADEKAVNILTELGLGHRLNYKVNNLSGGEKQRVAVARALVNDANLLLADEPTANLDSKSGGAVMQFLKNIAKQENKAVIIVSHDMRLLDIADRVLWLEDGLIRDGGHEPVTDPTCEMKLDKASAPFTIELEGKKYYFCSTKCLEAFKRKHAIDN